ncbi:MAG: hypothetical protein ABIR46_04785, partial [Candidatus Saccharimonadales bacterium]
YDAKVQNLAKVLKSEVKFDNVEQALEFMNSYKQSESAPVPRQIHGMAENFITYASRFKVQSYINPRAAHRTTISMFCEAIRLCAEQFIEQHKLNELADLGNFDRRRMQVLA